MYYSGELRRGSEGVSPYLSGGLDHERQHGQLGRFDHRVAELVQLGGIDGVGMGFYEKACAIVSDLFFLDRFGWIDFFEFLLGPEFLAVGMFFADFCDLFPADGGGFVAEAVADEGGDVGNPLVAVSMLGRHDAVVGFTIDRSLHAVEQRQNDGVTFTEHSG